MNGDNTEALKEIEIAGFKNYQFFGSNHTVNGTACYLDKSPIGSNDVASKCFSLYENQTSNWVIIVPFDNQYFLEDLDKIDKELQRVHGVVFTYTGNPQISNPAPDNSLPLIISFAKTTDLFAGDVQNRTFPLSTDYRIQLEHKYIEHCDVMKPAYKFYVIAISIWGLATIFHILWTW